MPPKIDLTPFCDEESNRYALQAPRMVDGAVCATDGRILIRCSPEHVEPFEPTEGRFPPVEDVMIGIDAVKQWKTLAVDACGLCRNTGFLTGNCAHCIDGVDTCNYCDRSGECEWCSGTGKATTRCECEGTHKVFGRTIHANHAYLIDSLPSHEYGLCDVDALFFRFKHGDGKVMIPSEGN